MYKIEDIKKGFNRFGTNIDDLTDDEILYLFKNSMLGSCIKVNIEMNNIKHELSKTINWLYNKIKR